MNIREHTFTRELSNLHHDSMIELRGEFDFRVQWDFCLAEDIELKEQQIDIFPVHRNIW